MKLKIIILLFLGMTMQAQTAKKAAATSSKEGIFAEMETSKGKILLQLEYVKTPITVANFISLAEGTNAFVTTPNFQGKPFYNGLKFHRVINDFMIQGGDPMGNGSGDPGYKFKDEITDLKHNSAGILSMANSGPATNGSQFFITHKETPWLDGKHTIFGHVVNGMSVVNAITQDDIITNVTIIRNGAAAKKFDAAKVFSDYMATKAEDDKKQALIAEENRKKQEVAAAEAKRVYDAKYAPVAAAKVKYHEEQKKKATTTASGLQYVIVKKGNGNMPAAGTPIFVNYAGYLEDGTLFDSSIAEVNQEYGKFDANRASQNGYQPFPFTAGKKDGLIPGFLEALDHLKIGDRILAFIPANLGYGAQGAGNVIPPNSNIIFEIEIFDKMPTPKQ